MKRTGRIFLCLLALLFSVCGALSSCKKRETEQPAPPDTEQRPDNPGCRESSRELLIRFRAALPLAVSLLESYDRSLKTGSPLDPRFDRNFE